MKKLFILLIILLMGYLYASTPSQVLTANIERNSFSVVWHTDTAEVGYIQYAVATADIASATIVEDIRTSNLSDKIHFVKVSSVSPNTTYYFSINSGGSEYNNSGNYYQVKTATTESGFVFGRVIPEDVLSYPSGAKTNNDVIIFATAKQVSGGEYSLKRAALFNEVKSSAPYTAPYDKAYFTLADFKDKDGNVFTLQTGAQININGWSASDGFGGEHIVTAQEGVDVYTNVTLNRLSLLPIEDTVPPLKVTNVSAIAGNQEITIRWTPSISTDNAGTRVVMSTSNFPTTVTDGSTIYAGINDSYLNVGLIAGSTYYYSLFAYDNAASTNYSIPATISAVPYLQQISSGDILDDFEDGDTFSYFGQYWYTFDDAGSGGNTTITMNLITNNAANNTNYALSVSYTLGGGFQWPYAAAANKVTNDGFEEDLDKYLAVEFYARGSGHELAVYLNSAEIPTDDMYYYVLNTNTNWQKYVIPFTDFVQGGFGATRDINSVLQRMRAIEFRPFSKLAGETGLFIIDEIRFITSDVFAPEPVTGVTLNFLNDDPLSLSLEWTPSVSSDNAGTRIIRRTDRYPLNETDGTLLYDANGTTYVDNQLSDNIRYYYALYARDNNSNFSNPTKVLFGPFVNGQLQASYLDVSTNFRISNDALMNNDYVGGSITMSVLVETTQISASAVVTLTVTGITPTQVLTFNPSTTVNTVNVALTLTEGTYTLSFVATDADDQLSTERTLILKVAGNEAVALRAGSQILSYPSPYNPDQGGLALSYELNKDADIKVYIYNMVGKLVFREEYLSGFDGGSVGYNEVTIPAVNSFGQKWANGAYIVRLVSGTTFIGTGKYLVIK